MKRIGICLIVAAATTLIFAGATQAGMRTEAPKAEASETTAKAATADPFTQSKAWQKVGPNLQQAYLAASKAGFPDQGRLTCFVSANENLMEGDQAFLTSNGFIVQIASGYTARGQMAIKDLPAVAKLPFVRSIDTVSK